MNLKDRYAMFSKEELDIIEAGVILTKRALHKEDPLMFSKYASFANRTNSYEKENELFHEALVKEAYARSGKEPSRVPVEEAFRYQDFERAYFSVLEEVIDRVTAKTELEEIMQFAEIRNASEGDSLNIDIRSKNVYILSKVSNGRNASHIQRYFGQNVVLAPTPRQATIGFNIHQIASGRLDYGKEIAKAVRGVRTSMLKEVTNLIFGTANPIGNKFIENTFTESTFRLLAQKIQARNGSTNTMVFGTNIALGTVLPADNNLKLGLGRDYMAKGYIPSLFGYPAVELPQAVDYDLTSLIVPNNYIAIMSADTDKAIKIGMEGKTYIIQSDENNTADRNRTYTMEQRWDIQIATQSDVGLIKVS